MRICTISIKNTSVSISHCITLIFHKFVPDLIITLLLSLLYLLIDMLCIGLMQIRAYHNEVSSCSTSFFSNYLFRLYCHHFPLFHINYNIYSLRQINGYFILNEIGCVILFFNPINMVILWDLRANIGNMDHIVLLLLDMVITLSVYFHSSISHHVTPNPIWIWPRRSPCGWCV